jgi:heme a synthase
MYRNLIKIATILTFGIVVLGAFVRLSDAGLGCPDWPGCYGHATVPNEAHELAAAQAKFPGQTVEVRKGWIEMIHRYFASTLGLLIIAIAVVSWRRRNETVRGLTLPFLLVALVVFQGLLGMWTVTLRLYPAVVTAHLIGGMTTLALLTWLWLRQSRPASAYVTRHHDAFTRPARLALAILALQIVLGGWVSTNYAALACIDFPLCHGTLAPVADYVNGFYPLRDLGRTATGALLHQDALTAIHWGHRIGALVTFFVVAHLALRLLSSDRLKRLGLAVLAALALQIALGIGNVLLSLPLPLAVAHNAGAALLLVILVIVNYRLHNNN